MADAKRPRGSGLKRAFESIREPLKAIAGRQGFAEPEVLLRWREIVGEGLAGLSRPVQISYGRRGSGLGATLTVAVESARAPEIQHRSAEILERVNRFYGYAAVSRLKITQLGAAARAGGFAEAQRPFAPEAPAQRVAETKIDAEAAARAEALAAKASTPELRAALSGLGHSILTQPAAGSGTHDSKDPLKGD